MIIKKIPKIIAVLLIITFVLPTVAFAANMEDVSTRDWFYRHVAYGLRFGLIEGVDGGRFEPDRYVTRAEFITMLGRLHEYGNETIGTPGVGAFYTRYLDWAVEMGIIQGNEHGDLMPNAYITREQMAVIVFRYIEVFELWEYFISNFSAIAMPFQDNDISYWASVPIELLRIHILVSGARGHFFRPLDNASRAKALDTLVRICSAIYDRKHPITYLNGQSIEISNLRAMFNLYNNVSGALYRGYMFRLREDAVVSLEGHENIRVIRASVNLFRALTLQEILDFVDPELIVRIERNHIGFIGSPDPVPLDYLMNLNR